MAVCQPYLIGGWPYDSNTRSSCQGPVALISSFITRECDECRAGTTIGVVSEWNPRTRAAGLSTTDRTAAGLSTTIGVESEWNLRTAAGLSTTDRSRVRACMAEAKARAAAAAARDTAAAGVRQRPSSGASKW
eukprot:scaffold121006_cov69-Phaeocystis_antarctica.AAC.7